MAILTFFLAAPSYPQQYQADKGTIFTVYSENARYRLTSIPFDAYIPSLRGKSAVYWARENEPLYTIDRPFCDFSPPLNGTFLSDDGRVIVSVLNIWAHEESKDLSAIMVYRDGTLIKRFTVPDLTGCNVRRERCSPVYMNSDVLDAERSGVGSNYHKVFKEGVSEEEQFLSDFPVFAARGSVYLVDPHKTVHTFSLLEDACSELLRQLGRRLEGVAGEVLSERALTFGGFVRDWSRS